MVWIINLHHYLTSRSLIIAKHVPLDSTSNELSNSIWLAKIRLTVQKLWPWKPAQHQSNSESLTSWRESSNSRSPGHHTSSVKRLNVWEEHSNIWRPVSQRPKSPTFERSTLPRQTSADSNVWTFRGMFERLTSSLPMSEVSNVRNERSNVQYFHTNHPNMPTFERPEWTFELCTC